MVRLLITALPMALALTAPASSIAAANAVSLRLVNPGNILRDRELITVRMSRNLSTRFTNPWLADKDCRVPAQWTRDMHGNAVLSFVVDLAPNETRTLKLAPEAEVLPLCANLRPARAVLVENSTSGERVSVGSTRVRKSHRAGVDLYGFEGIGWESDEVGYRIYLDSRNKTDIFGKKQPAPILETIGLKRVPYHSMADWGMDILKVGDSLGIGALAAVVDNKLAAFEHYDAHRAAIIANGPVIATAEVSFDGWKVGAATTDLHTRYSIASGARLTKVEARPSRKAVQLATGIVRHEPASQLKSSGTLPWRYLATCGEQSLVPDMLGMAVFYRAADFAGEIPDKNSHVIRLSPGQDGTVSYYFGAFWSQDDERFRDCKSFSVHLDQLAQRLSYPAVTTVR